MKPDLLLSMRVMALCWLLLAAPSTAIAQDAAAGETTFKICRNCHQIGPNAQNSVGPMLTGVIGRKSGSVPDYPYSDANRNSGIVWTEEELTDYLKNPRAKVPGTKMAFGGLRKEEDIKNVIVYLKQFTSSSN
jgi:cytochrome c